MIGIYLGPEIHDDALDVREDLVALLRLVVAVGHLDAELVDRLRLEAVVAEELHELVPVGDPCRLDVDRARHVRLLSVSFWIRYVSAA